MNSRRILGAVALVMTRSSHLSSSLTDPDGSPEDFDLQGHRGARGLAPENTLPAFRRALELGVTTLEMDVVISGDETVVVSHEPWMAHEICSLPSGAPVPAETEKEHNLYRMPYDEIERYDCGRRQHPDFPRQQPQPAVKPRLRDVIAAAETSTAERARPPVRYNIEIKSRPDWDGDFHPAPDVFARRVVDVVREEGITARTTIQSFDVRALKAVRRLCAAPSPDISLQRALLVEEGTADGLPDQLGRLGFLPAVYSPEYRSVDGMLLRAAHDYGLRVVPWTVNERDDMRRLIRLGVDGLITDYPDVAQEVMGAMEESSD